MFKKLRQELKAGREHMNYVPASLNTKDEAIEELQKLASRPNSRFQIKFNSNQLEITGKPDNVIIIISLLIFLAFPIGFITQNPHSPWGWVVLFSLLLAFYLFFRFYPTSYSNTIDWKKQTLTIRNNNIIGRYLVPKIIIRIIDVKRLTYSERQLNNNGMAIKYHRIYLETDQNKKFFIELLAGPAYFVNHKVFIQCLEILLELPDSERKTE